MVLVRERGFEVEATSMGKGFVNEESAIVLEILKSKADVAVTRKNVRGKLDFAPR
jgi:hypothetical protein